MFLAVSQQFKCHDLMKVVAFEYIVNLIRKFFLFAYKKGNYLPF